MLSKEKFHQLLDSGLLFEFYPECNGTYENYVQLAGVEPLAELSEELKKIVSGAIRLSGVPKNDRRYRFGMDSFTNDLSSVLEKYVILKRKGQS